MLPPLELALNTGSVGTLNIGSDVGPAVAAGTLNASSVVFGAGTGTLNFSHTSTGYNFGAAMSSGTGSATINQLAGITNLTGDSSAFSGTTNVTGDTLGVTGSTGKLGSATSTMNVSNGTLAVLGGGVVNSANTNIGAPAGSNGIEPSTGQAHR